MLHLYKHETLKNTRNNVMYNLHIVDNNVNHFLTYIFAILDCR